MRRNRLAAAAATIVLAALAGCGDDGGGGSGGGGEAGSTGDAKVIDVKSMEGAKGTVTYCGVFGGRDLAEAVIEKLAGAIQLNLQPLPDRVRVVRRGAYAIAMNFSDQAVATPAPAGTDFVIGSAELAPAGVAVWKA